MNQGRNPSSDFILLNTKKIAQQGGEYGPEFDQGVLSVIEEIERNGTFTRGEGLGGVFLLMKDGKMADGRGLATEEEAEAARKFLAEHGWSIEQGVKYDEGIQ